jgi:hypothetical protein
MPKPKKSKKKTKKTKKSSKQQTKVILVPEDDIGSEDHDPKEDFDEGGMYLEKEDLKIIYNALSKYTPTEKEEHLHSLLLEEFEEILVVDYNEAYPDAK